MDTTILIASGEPILREGLAQRLPDLAGARVVGEAGTADELRGEVARCQPAVVVVDLDLPGGLALDALGEIAQAGTRCVALSPTNARVHLERAMRAGATGYVVKAGSLDDLAQAIIEVAAGRTYVSRSASQYLVDVLHEGGRRRSDSLFDLTRREREVLEAIVSGFSCREIAERLGISARTVERHRASVMSKLDIHKTAKLVRFAVREGLVAA